MQTSYPSDHVGNPVTVRRIIFALGLAVAVAVTLIATNQIDSVRTKASAPALVPSTTAAQPKQRPSKIVPDFDNVARADLQRKVQKSINASLLRLGDDLAGNGID